MTLIRRLINYFTYVIPFKSDALFWLTGRITKVGSDYYFFDKSGNNRHFLITNYDFDTTWKLGFPYKSVATISAPIADATLIAADVNNFLYDSGGTPNAIPVVSFFQNIDYADKLFCRHIAQKVNSNDVEIYQPRIVDIVLYDNIKTSTDLTLCNTYFGVPTRDTAIWVSPSGNDSTGTGTESLPVATITKALTLTGTQIYVKTGIYDANNTFYTLSKSIKALGLVTHINTPASYLFLINSNSTIEGLYFTRSTVGTYPLFISGATTPVIKRCYIKDHVRVCIASSGIGGAVFQYCIVKLPTSTTNTFTVQKKSITIDSCYISDNTQVSIACSYASGGIILNVKNNKVLKNYSGAGTFIYVTYDSDLVDLRGNQFTNLGIIDFVDTNLTILNFCYNKGSIAYIKGAGTGTGSVNVIGNNISSDDTHYKIDLKNKNLECHNNIIYNTGNAGFVAVNSTINSILVNITKNRFHANGDSTSVSIGLDEIGTYANYIAGTYKYNIMIQDKVFPANTHGVQVLNNNFDVRYNKAIGVALAFVFKGSNIDLNTSILSHNIADDGYLLLKGVNLLKVYNNSVKGVTYSPSLWIMPNVSYLEMDNNDVRNNIFTSELASGSWGLCYIEDAGHVNTLDYNCLFTSGLEYGQIDTTKYATFALWQAQGYETNGINQDPLFDANLIPSVPLDNGVDLGVAYDDGLDITTDWGSDTKIPNVILKQQTGAWQLGAYIQ